MKKAKKKKKQKKGWQGSNYKLVSPRRLVSRGFYRFNLGRVLFLLRRAFDPDCQPPQSARLSLLFH